MLVYLQDVRRAFLALPSADGVDQEGFAQILWRLDIGPRPMFKDVPCQCLLGKGLWRAKQPPRQKEGRGGDHQDAEELMHPGNQAQGGGARETVEGDKGYEGGD